MEMVGWKASQAQMFEHSRRDESLIDLDSALQFADPVDQHEAQAASATYKKDVAQRLIDQALVRSILQQG